MKWYESSGERHYYIMEVDSAVSIDARYKVRTLSRSLLWPPASLT